MPIEQKKLEELKKKLEVEKTELEENLNRIAKPINAKEGDYETSFESIGEDNDDNATEVDQYTQNLSVESSLEKQLQDIIDALEKMETGAYGICENCQKEIPLERLMVNPSAKLCIEC